MSVNETVERQIRELPDRPGIYVFRDAAGRALYVGKAKSLRKRGGSYLRDAQEARIASMLAEATSIESVLTDSESAALLLENNWIKEKKPHYNVLLRDDKTYPYLKLTLRDDYPRIAFTRRLRKDGAEYYGPYLPAGLARRAINLVQRLFEIRVCTIEIDGKLPRPCLYYDLRRCLGPCVEGLTSQEAYATAVRQARLFLNGRNDQLLRELKQEMMSASEAEAFEAAARYRDMIAEIEAIGRRRSLDSLGGEDADIFGIYTAGGDVALVALVMRGGRVLDRRELFWEGGQRLDAAAVMNEMLPQIYDRTSFIPKEIHLPMAIEGAAALTDWLSERKGERVYLRLPARGAKAQRVRMAMNNARLAFQRRFRRRAEELEAVARLTEVLDLAEMPSRIEGFDISNLQGSQAVGSLVVWEGGRMKKADYRSFNVKGLTQPDDYGAIRHVVSRRYRRRLEELGTMPDLILIDGGRGQLNAALEALGELGVEDTPVVGLAKREEELYLPNSPEPIRLDRFDAGLQLLQQIRDEAHRFALSRHRRRRSRSALETVLDRFDGIGPARRRRLLRRFGSVAGVREASAEELRQLLGPAVGERLFRQLRQTDETQEAIDAG